MGNVDLKSESKLFKVKNQGYIDQISNYVKWNDLYHGCDKVEGKNEYLPRHPFESNDQYQVRLKRSAYRNFASPIANVFNSSVCRVPPDRSNLPFDEYLLKNVDRMGSSESFYFKDIINKASYLGVVFVLIDSTRAPYGTSLKTVSDYKLYNIRPYFKTVLPFDLIDWDYSIDLSGEVNLEYIVVRDNIQVGYNKPFMPTIYKEVARVWTRKEWAVYEEDKTGETDNGIKIVTDEETGEPLQGEHNLGKIPIVPFYFEKESDMVGKSSFSSVDTQILKLFRKESELDKAEFDCAIELLFGRNISVTEANGFTRSSSNGFFTSNPGADLKYVAPSGVVFDTLRQSISDTKIHIIETALRMTRPDTKVGESAESKIIDRDQLTSIMVSFAANCEWAEGKCWDFFNLWQSGEELSTEQKPSYNKNLDVGFAAEIYFDFMLKLEQDMIISKDTIRKILPKTRIPLPEDFDPVEESQVIEKESFGQPIAQTDNFNQ